MWESSLKKADLNVRDPSTGRLTITSHGLRRYFRTQLTANLPDAVIEKLMGHSGYLTSSYLRLSDEKIAELYIEAEKCLNITDVANVASRMRKLETDNAHIRKQLDGISSMFTEFMTYFDGSELYFKESFKESIDEINDTLARE